MKKLKKFFRRKEHFFWRFLTVLNWLENLKSLSVKLKEWGVDISSWLQ